MTGQSPTDAAVADADGGTTAPAAAPLHGGRLIGLLLLAAAALDLIRCGLLVATTGHAWPAIGLLSAGLAAAALSLWTARACQRGQRWAGWAALLIGAASAPQAAASGFHVPYAMPDAATAVLGVLLTVAVLATAGQGQRPDRYPEDPCTIDGRFTPMTIGRAYSPPPPRRPRAPGPRVPLRVRARMKSGKQAASASRPGTV